MAHKLITLNDAKTYLGVTGDDDDVLIEGLITAATASLEKACDAVFLQREITERQRPKGRDGRNIYLHHYPVVSVTTIEDDEGNTVAADQYIIHADQGVLAHKISWPVPAHAPAGTWKVTYTAGRWASADDVPDDLRLACRMLVARRYESRVDWHTVRLGDYSRNDPHTSDAVLPFSVLALIEPYKSVGV